MEHWDEIRLTDRYFFSSHDFVGIVRRNPMFPAIAIPVEKKRGFECPHHLLDELISLLPQVTKILVIGWRATEAHFLYLLRDGLRPGCQLYIVGGRRGPKGEEPGEEIRARIHSALLINPPNFSAIDPGGFSDFTLSRRAEEFLRD